MDPNHLKAFRGRFICCDSPILSLSHLTSHALILLTPLALGQTRIIMFPGRDAPSTVVFLLLALSWVPLVCALNIEYCASFNTGSTPNNSSIYQTNGLCRDFCIDDYAFAITQDKLCWCSNYIPSKSTQEDTSKCDIPCPAWPSENCGGDGLYGYVSLGNVIPSGTQGPFSSSTKTKKETSTSTGDESSSITTEADPTTSLLQIVTAGGTIKTVTIAPTQQTADTSDTPPASGNTGEAYKKNGLRTGEIVGIILGVIAGVIGTAFLLLFFRFRRKKEHNEQETYTLQIDPRMDPFKRGLYVRSTSRESINTLRDDYDYSRRIQVPKVLRATNPDPVHTS